MDSDLSHLASVTAWLIDQSWRGVVFGRGGVESPPVTARTISKNARFRA